MFIDVPEEPTLTISQYQAMEKVASKYRLIASLLNYLVFFCIGMYLQNWYYFAIGILIFLAGFYYVNILVFFRMFTKLWGK